MAQQYFAGAIWTNHALERLAERRLSQEMAGRTFSHPDKVIHGKQAGTTEFHRRFNDHWITVVAKKTEKNEWIVVSCWIDPPFPGTKDYKRKEIYREYQKAGFFRKLWLTFKQQMYS